MRKSQTFQEVEPLAAPASLDETQPERLISAYGRALLEQARRDPRIVALDADLMVDMGLLPFAEHLPERFIECGIAEMDMVSQAGGLALRGMLPVCNSFACFMTARANEHIFVNASERTKIIYTGGLAGRAGENMQVGDLNDEIRYLRHRAAASGAGTRKSTRQMDQLHFSRLR